MATISRQTQTQTKRFCENCGTEATGAFCPGCGQRITPQAESRAYAPPAARSRVSSRGALMAAGVALALAGIAAAVIILASGSGSSTPAQSSATSYRTHLNVALTPVVSANQTLSGALTSLNGTPASVTSAQNAASQAQTALTAARGALAVLTVPAADASLSQQAQQAVTQDSGYVQAVASTLQHPVGQSSSQLQTLATGAQTALVALDSVVSGASASVIGTSNLLAWAAGANAAAQRQSAAAQGRAARAQQHAVQQAAASGAQQGGSSAAAGAPTIVPVGGGAAVSTTGALACGGGLMAGPHTSCPFAENVQQAWQAAPGQSAVVTAFSPVTGQSYTMSCGPDSAGGILCIGIGANNSVWW
jgi:hypothetical protein